MAGVPKGRSTIISKADAFAVEVLTEYWDSMVATYGPILADHNMAPLVRIACFRQQKTLQRRGEPYIFCRDFLHHLDL